METIYVVGYIDSFSLACLIMDFEAIPNDRDVNIVICSGGGSVTAGTAMQAIIISEAKKRGNDKIKGLIIGECASIATIISTAIPKGNLKIADSAMFMIHAVRVAGDDDVYQTADQLREMADVMDKFNDNLSNQLALRSGKSLDYIKATYFDGKDHYLSASLAVSEGFCDEVETLELPQIGEEETEIEDLKLRKFVNKEDRLKLVAVFESKKSVQIKPRAIMQTDILDGAKQVPNLEANDTQVNSLVSDLQNSKAAIANISADYQAVSNQLHLANKEANELRNQLASIEKVHEQELANVQAGLEIAKKQLEDAVYNNEVTKFINIEAFALGVPLQEVSKFLDEQLKAITGGYVKTNEGYACKAEKNAIVATTVEQVVKHRITNYVLPFFRPINKPINQGSGFNAINTQAKPFGNQSNNDLDRRKKELLELANRQGVVYGSARFKELCNQNGLEVF